MNLLLAATAIALFLALDLLCFFWLRSAMRADARLARARRGTGRRRDDDGSRGLR